MMTVTIASIITDHKSANENNRSNIKRILQNLIRIGPKYSKVVFGQVAILKVIHMYRIGLLDSMPTILLYNLITATN